MTTFQTRIVSAALSVGGTFALVAFASPQVAPRMIGFAAAPVSIGALTVVG
ncbi:hypothetical protein [Sphingomonas sp. 1P08PE]|uniref:hypothetical protein n=1 Tax=Sphingomonas sp. 1P08PE TaxID=554122 RepID=UPI0039A33E41